MCTVYPGLGRGQHVSVRHLRHHEEDGLVQAVLAGVLSGLRSAQSEGKVALVVGRHLHQHLNLLVGPVHARDNLIAVHVGRLVFAHRVGPVVPAEAAAAGVELPLGVEAAAVARARCRLSRRGWRSRGATSRPARRGPSTGRARIPGRPKN